MNTTPDNTVEPPVETRAKMLGVGPSASEECSTGESQTPPGGSTVMLSIPYVATQGDEVLTEPNLGGQDGQTRPCTVTNETFDRGKGDDEHLVLGRVENKSSTVVPLGIPDGGPLQNCVQNTRQWFVSVAGSSLYWRLFVGSGFAFLIGALTLMVFGPSPDQLRKSTAESTVSNLKFVDQGTPPNSQATGRAPRPSVVELTVGNHEGTEGPVPAEFDDPFVDGNLVSTTIQHAIHRSNRAVGDQQEVVQQVSARRVVDAGPAWLSGTIEEDDVDSIQPLRDHERSRQSHR